MLRENMSSAPSTQILFELRGTGFKHVASFQATFVFNFVNGTSERIAAGFKRTAFGDEAALFLHN